MEALRLDDRQRRRLERMYAAYRRMGTEPEDSDPAFIIDVPVRDVPAYTARFADPRAMLAVELEVLRRHLQVEDDCVPTVRVQFGTGLVPSAFGCDTFVPDDELPCCKGPMIRERAEIAGLRMPAENAGLLGKLEEFTQYFLENLPEGVHVQHPDIQSPFNNAYSIRGNDLFLEMMDAPDVVDLLLTTVTDYMIMLVPRLKGMISADRGWFFDMGALWKGTARISNCSTTMIDPRMYDRFVLPQDSRLFQAMGGGRVHYCGTSPEVIQSFMRIPGVSGLDYDPKLHDLWRLSEVVPANVTLLQTVEMSSETGRRLLAGDWPRKRNIIIQTSAPSVEEGRKVLQDLKRSVPA